MKHTLKVFLACASAMCISVTPAFSSVLKNQNHSHNLYSNQTNSDDYNVLVKFNHQHRISLENQKINFLSGESELVSKFASVFEQFPAKYSRVLDYTKEELEQYSSFAPFKKSGFDKLKFAGFMKVEFDKRLSKAELLKFANELEKFDEVEYVELQPKEQPRMNQVSEKLIPNFDSDYIGPTPDFSDRQGYQRAEEGVNVDYAWELGLKGEGIHLNDIEYDWGDLKHEEFIGQDITYGLERQSPAYKDHGIAVIGILVANAENGIGIKGATPKAKMSLWSEIYGRAKAILSAGEKNSKGDIIMLEMQTGGAEGRYVPADYSQSVWDAVKSLTDAGIIIVAAAGNGSVDLDGASYKAYRDRGDNGSIIVGAGSPNSAKTRLDFSTYGERVDVQGWGTSVFTTGYGHVPNLDHDYTHGFGGTSSATPIVTQAVALIQECSKKTGKTLTSVEMRELLVKTGDKPQQDQKIGPLPNIKKAIKSLNDCAAAVDEDQPTKN